MGNNFNKSVLSEWTNRRPMNAIEIHEDIDPVEQIRPSKRFKSSESMSLVHQGSTPSSPPTIKPSQPSLVDSVNISPPMDDREMYGKIDPVEQIKRSKRIKYSEFINPGHHGCTPSSPPTMEPSRPSLVDAVNSSPMDEIDPVEQIKPSKRKSSESMNPGHDESTPSSPPRMEPSKPSLVDSVHSSPLMDAIESIRERYEKIDPVERIDPLISFIENQLQRMNTPSEAGSSCSEGLLATVRDSTKLAAKAVDTISTEAEKLSNSDAVKAMESVTLNLLKGVGDLHWVFIGLSVAAYAVEKYLCVGSTDKECREILRNILELATEVNQHSRRLCDEREKLCSAVGTIVEGAVIYCDCLKRQKISRFWSPTTAAAQVAKTNQQLGKDYGEGKDVFLSHSGKQKNFVRQLYVDLTREHVSCFFDEDDNSLPLGRKFPPLIFKAAETCKTAIVVLSEDFIRSRWPMLELSAFIRAKKTGNNPKLELLPIFFMISPKELSHITKDNPEWKKLEESDPIRGEWQDALKEVRSMKGLQLAEDGNEVDCRNKIVKKICCFLRAINPPKLLDFEPVGIERQVDEVKGLLDMEGVQSALAVIVYGFGGVGKSTVAASVVQSLDWCSTDFKFCRVAIDENTQNKTSHIMELQKYIINMLGGVTFNFQDPADGRFQIKKDLKKSCFLLFIDNVVDKDYVRELLPQDLQSVEQETKLRIIITSRDKNVKAELNIMCNEYEVKGLSEEDSKRLLVETVVQSQIIEDDEKRMIDEVAVACRGVPLLLSVFGKHLKVERNMYSFQEALDVLRKGNLDSYRDEDLSTKLMFVYDKIKDVEVKEAFLDICTYFHGWEWNLVADIVDIFKLEDLRRRTLVSKSDSDEVIVHDILRLMGMKEASLTRFSNYKELLVALEDNIDDNGKVKGISLVNNDLITITSTQLDAMHKSLRVLMLGDWVRLDGPPCHRAFRNLRYLSVGDITAFPFKDPSKLEKLRVFLNRSKPGMNLSCLPSSLKRLSHQVPYVECNVFTKLPFQNLSSLKSFIVKTQKSVELPEELHLPPSLVTLDLSGCNNLPKNIGHLTAVESLILDRCDLKCLPQGFGKLQRLKDLKMENCSKLAFLSEELCMLSSLKALRMNGCKNLKALPKSLGRLISLQTLELNGCKNLKVLPKSLGRLVSLQTLELKFSHLQLLPESFGELCMNSLKLDSLSCLNELPDSFGNMPLLKYFRLEFCDSLMSLPDSFVQLKMLETLKIYYCPKLSILPEDFGCLKCLQHMTVERCHLLKELPYGFGALPALKSLTLRCCNSFVNLPGDFTKLECLEELSLGNLPLKRIPDGFGKLKRLRYLSLEECFQLKTLSDDFENMASLELLKIRECSQLEGAMMEKILKLQNCPMADIEGSKKLLEKLEQMQSEIEHPIAVFSGIWTIDRKIGERAIMVALMNGKCVEVNNTSAQLVERSSLLVELQEGTRATVALILGPIQMLSRQHRMLQRFAEMARERAESKGSGKLHIVCARKVDLNAERTTATEEEERAEEEGIRQILLSLPRGSCAVPSTETKRAKIITWCCSSYFSGEMIWFLIGHVAVDMEGRKSFENFEVILEDEITYNVFLEKENEDEDVDDDSIKDFIGSNFSEQYPSIVDGHQPATSRFHWSAEDEDVDDDSIQNFIGSSFAEQYTSIVDQREPATSKFLGSSLTNRLSPQTSFSNSGVTSFQNLPPSEFSDVVSCYKHYNSIQNFIESICVGDAYRGGSQTNEQSYSQSVAGQSKTREFIEKLKGNGINHLDIEGQQVMVDDLHGKTIGFIIYDLKFLELIKLTHIYKHLQRDSNFIAISIPINWPESLGHGSYTRVSQCMPWATIPYPHLVEVGFLDPRFVVLDNEGQIANQNAWRLLLGWGLKFYPFTQHTIRESFASMESESCLEILLHGMNIVGRKPKKRSKMTFLYAARAGEWLEMKCKLEQCTQIHRDFEVLYVGKLNECELDFLDIEEYEDARQNICWASLSVSDWIMFWYRCFFFRSVEYYETLHGLARELVDRTSLVLVDNDGVVTLRGEDVLQMICDISNGEGMNELSRGECSVLPFVKTCFRDKIDNHPQHPQHCLSRMTRGVYNICEEYYVCEVCTCRMVVDYEQRSYWCQKCEWHMCGRCWMAYAKQEAEQLGRAKDN